MTAMPQDFLTRYNTTLSSCQCKDMEFAPINHRGNADYKCKHIRVMNDPSSYTFYDAPWPTPGPRVPTGWTNKYAYHFAMVEKFSLSEIMEYKNAMCAITGKYNSGKAGLTDIDSYYKFKTEYNTTRTRCLCERRERFPNEHCKHMIYVRQNGTPVLTTTNEGLINSIEELNKQRELLLKQQKDFETEKEEYIDSLKLCLVCYTEKTIESCSTCKKGVCVDCYNTIDKRSYNKPKCPWCRSQMEPVVDFLIKKFKEFNH